MCGQNENKKRVILLDVFRVCMALLIFMFHSRIHFGCSYGLLNHFVSVGALAMTGFFLLSGYVLRLVYGENDLLIKNELLKFYLKRLLCILPLYYAVSLLYIVFIGKETLFENLYLFPIEALGLQSTFASLFGMSHNDGTWFISCLLLGYLVYPFLQHVTKQLNTKYKILLIVVLMWVELWAAVIRTKFNIGSIYANPFYRIIEFAIGLLVADINLTAEGRMLNRLRSWFVFALTVVALLVGISVINYFYDTNDYMLLNWIVLPCFVIMFFGMGYNEVKWLEKSHVLGYSSELSYAFFLSQFFVWPLGRWFVERLGCDNNWIRILFSFSLCFIISVLMYEIVQRRMIGFIRKKYKI